MSTKVKGVLTRSHQMEISYATLLARDPSSLLSPLAWLTFSKLLELMPNGKGWSYDICLDTHLASGVDTSQHGAGAPATGSAKAKARRASCARSVLATAQHAAALEMGGHHSSYRYTSK